MNIWGGPVLQSDSICSRLLAAANESPLHIRLVDYITRRWDIIEQLFLEHLWLVLLSVGIAIVISVTVGIIISYYAGLAATVLTICQIIMTIPSMAMLGFMLPVFGIGFTTGVIALILYCLLPIVRNTYTGIKEISPAIIESARAHDRVAHSDQNQDPAGQAGHHAGIRTATVMVVDRGDRLLYWGGGLPAYF